MNDVKSAALNGRPIEIGSIVMSSPDDDYALLIGRVFDIELLGSENKGTENDCDDIYCNFMESEYSKQRIAEIEKDQSDLYQIPKTIEDTSLDYAIMDPKCLIVIDEVPTEVLTSAAEAKAFWDKEIAATVAYVYSNKKRWNPVTCYGLVIDFDTMEEIAEERGEDADELADKFNFTDYYEFDGTTYPLRTEGGIDSSKPKEVEGYNFYILYSDKTESIFGKGYDDLEELIREFKVKMEGLLPEDFDYQDHVRYVSGVVFDN